MMNEEERQFFREAQEELTAFPSSKMVLGIVRSRANDAYRCAQKVRQLAIGALIVALLAVIVSVAASFVAYYEYNQRRLEAVSLRNSNNENFCGLINRTRRDLVRYLESFARNDKPVPPSIQRGVDLFSVQCVISPSGIVIPVTEKPSTTTTTTP